MMPLLYNRGNAVLRSAAKRQIEVDIEEGEAVGNGDGNAQVRVRKSKTKIVVQRILRMVRVVTFIAAFNFPLYIMLIFKDWIDI